MQIRDTNPEYKRQDERRKISMKWNQQISVVKKDSDTFFKY